MEYVSSHGSYSVKKPNHCPPEKRVQKLTTPLEFNFGAGCMKEIGGTIRDEIVIWYTTGNGIFSFFEGKGTESLQDHSNNYSAKAQKTVFQASDF